MQVYQLYTEQLETIINVARLVLFAALRLNGLLIRSNTSSGVISFYEFWGYTTESVRTSSIRVLRFVTP